MAQPSQKSKNEPVKAAQQTPAAPALIALDQKELAKFQAAGPKELAEVREFKIETTIEMSTINLMDNSETERRG